MYTFKWEKWEKLNKMKETSWYGLHQQATAYYLTSMLPMKQAAKYKNVRQSIERICRLSPAARFVRYMTSSDAKHGG